MDKLLSPDHYQKTGYQCREAAEHLPFNLGNAYKYQFRAGSKLHPGMDERQSAIVDLEKCCVYLRWEEQRIRRRIESLKSLETQSSTSEDSSSPTTQGSCSSGSRSIQEWVAGAFAEWLVENRGKPVTDTWKWILLKLDRETAATAAPKSP